MKINEIVPWLIEAPAPFFSTDSEDGGQDRMREYDFVEVRVSRLFDLDYLGADHGHKDGGTSDNELEDGTTAK